MVKVEEEEYPHHNQSNRILQVQQERALRYVASPSFAIGNSIRAIEAESVGASAISNGELRKAGEQCTGKECAVENAIASFEL